MPHLPPYIWAHTHDWSLQLLHLSLLQLSRVIQIKKIIHFLPGRVRPTCRPLAQRLSSSVSSAWTSMASLPVTVTSSGGIWSIADLGICGVTLLGVWGGLLMASLHKYNAGPCELSAPITVAIESIVSNHGSSYASPSDSSMTAFQSHGCCWLSGSVFSSRSVCPAPSSFSSNNNSRNGTTHHSAGPKPGYLGCFCWCTWHIVFLGHSGPLFSPGKDLSSAQASPCTGIHSTSFIVGLYVRTLPSNTRPLTTHR